MFPVPDVICLTVLIGQLFLAGSGLCLTVQLSYTTNEITGTSMADIINVTLTTELNESLILNLQKVEHMSEGIPIHTFVLGPDGGFGTQKEIVGDTENTAFYQDLINDAVMEVKRTREDDVARLNFKGQFRYNGSLHAMNHVTRSKREAELGEDVYQLLAQPETLPVNDDGIRPPHFPFAQSQVDVEPLMPSSLNVTSLLLQRIRRQTNPIYYIDLVAVVDFRAYSRFLSSSESRASALKSVLEYYTFVVTGIDLLYQGITTTNYRMRVRLVKVIVAESATFSYFTEEFRQADSPYDTTDADSGLDAFRSFVLGSSTVKPYDHVMLFTGFDLTRITVSKSLVGLAYIGTLCSSDGDSTSIVEDLGGFASINTAAHELAHSISAQHDGVHNTCSGSDGFIMSATSTASTATTKLNPWKFSSCSVMYFTIYITALLTTTSGTSCLTETLEADPSIPDVGESLPGLKYSANDQCKMLQGNSSSVFCPAVTTVNVYDDPSLICTQMFCSVPGSSNCRHYSAARGTVCGDGKLCVSGECMTHPSAPHVNETCMFGDDPFFNCSKNIAENPWLCYTFNKECCETCNAFYRPVQGCEYGDRDLTCTKDDCVIPYNLFICCATCNGAPLTTSSTTRRIVTTGRIVTNRRIVTTTPRKTTIKTPKTAPTATTMPTTTFITTPTITTKPKINSAPKTTNTTLVSQLFMLAAYFKAVCHSMTQ